MKTTKRALLSSVMALVLCFAMLLGTTYAWFTDTVTSGSNVIQAGTLDIDVQYTLDGENWADLDGADDLFQKGLWEPGHTEVVALKVTNKGNLALKYSAKMNIISEAVGKNKDGGNIVLSEILTVGTLVHAANQIGDISVALAFENENMFKGTTAFKDANILGENQELQPGAAHYVIIKVDMAESVGNEANHDGKNVPTIEFGINVIATQFSYENDSFGKDYDVNATYLNKDASGAWLINNMDELFYFAANVNNGNTYKGETVKLTADIDLTGYSWAPIGQPGPGGSTDFSNSFKGTFDGQGHTVSNLKASGYGWQGLFGLAHTATIKNITVNGATVSANRMAGAIVGQLYGSLENCHVENVTITATPNWTSKGYDNGDKIGGIVGWLGDNGNNHHITDCTATNVTLKAYRDVAGIAGYIGSTTTVENCSVDTINITVDQNTNSYGAKDYNAGGVVGRIAYQPVTIQNNTEANVAITYVWTGNVPATKPNSLVVDTAANLISVNDANAFAYLNTLINDANFATTYGSKWKYSIELNADIDLANHEWTPIVMSNFIGFDGNGHTISNLCVSSGSNNVGLFGYISCNDLGYCTVKNLTVDGANVKGGNYAGAFLGYGNCTVENVTVLNATVEAGKYVGGLAGRASNIKNSTIKNSTVVATDKTVGGLVGYCINDPGIGSATNNTVENVTVTGAYNVGGMLGQAQNVVVEGNTVKNATVISTTALPASASSNEVRTAELAARSVFANTTIGANTVENVTCTEK